MEIQTLAGGIIFLIIFYIIKRPRVGPNEPPLVPYTIPIIGHTFSYLLNTKNFIEQCKEQHGECFSVYVYGRVLTIVSRKFMNEVFKHSEHFDLGLASREYVPFHVLLPYNGGVTAETMKFITKTSREQVSGKLDSNLPIVQKYLLKGMDKWIGDCEEPRTFYNAWFLVNNIVALTVANIFVGEEAASHEDLVQSFADLAFDLSPLMLIPHVFSFIHKKVHEFVITLPLRFGWNPVARHRQVISNRIRPVIEKRLKEKKIFGDDYKPYNDLIEYYMNQPNFNYSEPDNLNYHIDNLFIMIFAAVVVTSKATANALYDLAGRPDCLQELYEEAQMVVKESNGSTLTPADIQKMKKLDSFFKESLRFTNDTLALPQYMVSKSFTFTNGFTIPNDRLTLMYVDDSLKSKDSYGEDAEEFKPFRFVNANSPATKVERSYVAFGGGRHACPGRFFAVNDVKLILHNLILKYNITSKSGKVANKIVIGPVTSPSRSGLIFEKRKEKIM